jgi:hypothetical protein
MTDFAYPQPYQGLGIEPIENPEGLKTLSEWYSGATCRHGKSSFDSSHTCDDVITGTKTIHRPITVPWLPIEQIGEVFPDWETDGKQYLLKNSEKIKRVCTYWHPYKTKKEAWYFGNAVDDYGYEWEAVKFFPTHFSPVVLEG